jgi:hypothetical protein
VALLGQLARPSHLSAPAGRLTYADSLEVDGVFELSRHLLRLVSGGTRTALTLPDCRERVRRNRQCRAARQGRRQQRTSAEADAPPPPNQSKAARACRRRAVIAVAAATILERRDPHILK